MLSPAPSVPRQGALLYSLLFMLGLLAWLLSHPYQGFFHDANLYALQALAHLDRASLSHDIFLSQGSQDRYTLFSPLYAVLISLLGLDHAAALLTLTSQAGLCAAAWWLAQTLLPRWAAAAGVVLLLALPCEYGPLRVFTCVEPFLTPRVAAEALTLAALAAALRRRRLPALALGALAVVLHPVMAVAGIAAGIVACLLGVWQRGARRRALGFALLLLVAGCSTALLLRGRFDPDWLSIVRARTPYLFLDGWHTEDVSRALSGLLPLAAGARVCDGVLGRACLSIVLATVAGWIATLLGADWLHSVLLTQAQPWRIEWLASTTGALLLPYVLAVLWQGDAGRRSTALLLVAALIFRAQTCAIPIGLGALVLLWLQPRDPRQARLVGFGAIAVCTLAAVWCVASDLQFTDLHYLNGALPLWLRGTMSFVKDGVVPAALLGGVLWLDTRRARIASLGLLCIGSVAAIGIARHTLSDWLAQSYPAARIAAFAPWRSLLPAQAQVFWTDSPLSTWALLGRAHYLSGLQSSGVVFSETGARELKRRAEGLASIIAPANFLEWDFITQTVPLDVAGLLAVCRLGVIDYVVSEADLGLQPLSVIMPPGARRQTLRLYRCATPS